MQKQFLTFHSQPSSQCQMNIRAGKLNFKKFMNSQHILAGIIFLLPCSAYADMPLTVEELITDKGKVKLDFSLIYANSDRLGVSTGESIRIQTGAASFITLPTQVGESNGNFDSLVGSIGLRYGLTEKTEIYTRFSYLYSSTRTSDLTGIKNDSKNHFVDAWIGGSYQFKKDGDTPALLGFAEVALREKHEFSSSSFRSAMFGITTYKAIDPIVFSITAAYRFNQNRKDGAVDYKPGNNIYLNPSVAFAVNERVTLSGGAQWSNRLPDKRNGKIQGFRRTSSDLLVGASYGISKGSTLNLTFKSNVSGSDGSDLRLNWLHTL